jgi:ABC-type phosphate/phosphonate transport system permease subunit
MATKLSKAKASPTLADATDMIWHRAEIHMYCVSDSQLEELTAGYNSFHLVFLGLFFGAFIAFLIAFKQEPSTAPERIYYFSTSLISAVAAIFFGVNGVTNYVRALKRKKKLLQESIPMEK